MRGNYVGIYYRYMYLLHIVVDRGLIEYERRLENADLSLSLFVGILARNTGV